MERFLYGIYTVLTSLILLSVILTTGTFAEETKTPPQIQAVVDNASSASGMNVVYQTSTTGSDWTPAVTTNQVSGQADTPIGLDAFAMSIPQSVGEVKYRAHVENEGWKDWVEGSEYTGNPESDNDIQALQIELEGEAAKNYDVYYRTNVENFGWLDWAKNGEVAGTTGYGDNVQAVQVTYTEKGAAAPGATACASVDQAQMQSLAEIDYTTHISDVGWQGTVHDGEVAGTTGEHLSIEAIKIDLPFAEQLGDNSSVHYNLQVQDIGWTPEVTDGTPAGTVGENKNAETLKVKLTGRADAAFDVYYRVHSAYYGWLDWAKNGQDAGTTGIATPAEAVQIQLVAKNSAAPGPTDRPVISPEYLQARSNINYNTHVTDIGWQGGFSNGADAGTTGQSKAIEAFTVEMPQKSENSAVSYQAHITDLGWQEPALDGGIAGSVGEGKAVQAFTISLNGEDAYSYDIYYRAYCQDYGWLGWAKNGEWAGTTGGGKRLEAMSVVLVPRGGAAPGSTENAYINIVPIQTENWLWPLDNYTRLSSGFGWRGSFHYGIDIPAPEGTPIKAAKSGTVTICGWYYGYGQCVVITNDQGGEDVYYGHMIGFNTTAGAHVNQGDVIGFVGSTGNSTGNHLHLGICDHGTWLNPLDLY